jgi:VWFA-related protein
VVIGGSTYICPLKGVAISKIPVLADPGKLQPPPVPVRTQVNDVSFTQYHVFRAESHIMAANEQPAATPDTSATTPASNAGADTNPGAPGPDSRTWISAAAQNPEDRPNAPPTVLSPTSKLTAEPSPPAFIPGPDATVLQAYAKVVLVDVVVTDRDKAVHGLPQNHFHIFEDGREQPIASFDEHLPGTAPAIRPPAALPPHTYTNVPACPATSAVNVLLLDSLNTPLASQQEVHRQVLQYLAGLQPGTSLAVFSLSSQLRMVLGFTTDVSLLTKALQSAKAGSQTSTVLNTEGGSSMSAAGARLATAGDADNSVTLESLLQLLQFTADIKTRETDQRVGLTLGALQQLGRYLSGVPGRKNLIWFSGSFPIALGLDTSIPIVAQDNPLKNFRSYAEAVRQTGQLLSAARVAVYPVDARGVMGLPSSNASYVASTSLSQGTGTLVNTPGVPRDDADFATQTTAEQGSMTSIADQTGGHAYVNTNGLKEAVEKVIENGSSYYTIGYVPPAQKPSDQFRKIRLHLDNAGYKLAYRPGYYADDPNKPSSSGSNPVTSPMQSATLLGAPPATQILFQARVLAVTDPQLQVIKLEAGPAGDLAASLKTPVQRYIVDIAVDAHGLTFEEQPDGAHRTRIEYAAVAYDAQTKRVNYLDRGVQLTISAEQFARTMAAGIPLRLALDLPAGQIALRVAVYDPATAHAGSLEIPMTIAPR